MLTKHIQYLEYAEIYQDLDFLTKVMTDLTDELDQVEDFTNLSDTRLLKFIQNSEFEMFYSLIYEGYYTITKHRENYNKGLFADNLTYKFKTLKNLSALGFTRADKMESNFNNIKSTHKRGRKPSITTLREEKITEFAYYWIRKNFHKIANGKLSKITNVIFRAMIFHLKKINLESDFIELFKKAVMLLKIENIQSEEQTDFNNTFCYTQEVGELLEILYIGTMRFGFKLIKPENESETLGETLQREIIDDEILVKIIKNFF